MRQYRIWNNIQSCLFKNNGGKNSKSPYTYKQLNDLKKLSD